jgi:hypothetical protein
VLRREHLREQGWPRPLFAHFGNGAHLVYGIDLSNDPDSTQLLSAFLQAIATRFGDAEVAIDTSIFNAARISKLYGTVVRKWNATEDRPHRRATILDAPEALETVPVEAIRQIAQSVPATATRPGPGPGPSAVVRPLPVASQEKVRWMDGFLARHGIEVRFARAEGGTWAYRWGLPCPFCGGGGRRRRSGHPQPRGALRLLLPAQPVQRQGR